ncbi:MAG: hypothetical protein ACRETL_00890 [Gammaproteobacteria bacterium]
MGYSPQRAISMHVVLNLLTGSLLGHFHVVFDGWFTPIIMPESTTDQHSELWSYLFGTSRFQHDFGEGNPVLGLHDAWPIDEDKCTTSSANTGPPR